MDPRERADAALARARARGTFVITPDDAISPMDAASTLQIPRSVVAAAESENTMIIPTGQIRQPPPYPASPPPKPAPAMHREVEQMEEPPALRQLDGLVPTVHQPAPRRSTLSRRLDGN